MHLTLYTDYSLRMLMYLAAKGDTATVAEIAARYGVSRNHLVKVAHNLGQLGYIETFRGKTGGLRLTRPPQDINLGDVVRDVEPHFDLVECFRADGGCPITPACRLKSILAEAQRAFHESLGQYSLADVTRNRNALLRLLPE